MLTVVNKNQNKMVLSSVCDHRLLGPLSLTHTRAIQVHSLPSSKTSSSLKVLRANRNNLSKQVDSSFRMIPPSKSNLSQNK